MDTDPDLRLQPIFQDLSQLDTVNKKMVTALATGLATGSVLGLAAGYWVMHWVEKMATGGCKG